MAGLGIQLPDRRGSTGGKRIGEGGGRVGTEPCVVGEEVDLLGVCERLGEAPGVDTVAVVDEARRLVGVIPMRLLLDGLFLHVAPEEFLAALRGREGGEGM